MVLRLRGGCIASPVNPALFSLGQCATTPGGRFLLPATARTGWRGHDVQAASLLAMELGGPPALELTENPDILRTLSRAENRRPSLVVGFAAETEKVVEHAVEKRQRKGCDWILANDVSPETGTFGGDSNVIHFVHEDGVEDWPRMTKQEVADRLALRIAAHMGGAE